MGAGTLRARAELLERDRELAAVGELLGRAAAGAGGALLVEGPAGIGKSRVLGAARELAAGEGLAVVSARASELESSFDFGLVRQLFEPLLATADGEARARLLAGAAALAEPVLGARGFGAASAGRDDAALARLHGLYWLTVNLASRRPLLAVLDDVQWGDAPSLRWLNYLVHRIEGVPVALVVATRPAEPGSTAGELMIAVEALADVIRPAALSERAIHQLAARWLGGEPEEPFVAACQRATGANPFLLTELLRELAQQGVTPSREQASRIAGITPDRVRHRIVARLRALPPACEALARAVAILDDGVVLRLAAELAGLEHDVALDALDALARADVFVPDSQPAFAHPIIRAAVLGELTTRERSDGHAHAAERLLAEGAPVDRVALHLLACAPRRDERAVVVLRQAAAAASARGAPDVAATYLRRALQDPPPADTAADVTLELGVADLRAGQPASATAELGRALELTSDPRPRALAALELANALMLTARHTAAVAVLTEARSAVVDVDPELAGTLDAARWVASFSHLDAWRALHARPPDWLPGPRDPRSVGERVLVAREALAQAFFGSASEARTLALRALGDGELLKATGAHAAFFHLAVDPLIWAHWIDDAARHLDAALQQSRDRGSEVGFAVASHFRAALWWHRGALAEIEADARNALRSSAPFAIPLGAVFLARALTERGDVTAAAAQLREAGLDTGTPDALIGIFAVAARAHVRLAQRQAREALADLLECGRIEQAWGVRTPALTFWRTDAAMILHGLGDAAEARRLAAEALQAADAFGSALARGVALRAAALAGRREEERDMLERSVDELRASGARLELARSLIELGAARRRRNERAEARAPLREALELAVSCGADALATHAHDELLTAGARPRRDPVERRLRLTAGEQRVARMAADGMSNREIAQALFLTEKTIETHLSSVYRKLDIRSRVQLVDALPAAGEALSGFRSP